MKTQYCVDVPPPPSVIVGFSCLARFDSHSYIHTCTHSYIHIYTVMNVNLFGAFCKVHGHEKRMVPFCVWCDLDFSRLQWVSEWWHISRWFLSKLCTLDTLYLQFSTSVNNTSVFTSRRIVHSICRFLL